MRTSVYLILIQIANIIVGFLTIYLVAKNVEPELYALIGINAIVCVFLSVFSYFGFEAHVQRKGLAWIQKNQINKLNYYITNALYSRMLLSIILMPIVIFYCYYLSYENFNGSYFIEFVLFCLSGVFYSINSSCILIKKGLNQFVSAAMVTFFSTTIMKLLALYVFFYFGFEYYIFSLVFTPLIISFLFVPLIKKHFRFKYIRFYILKHYQANKSFSFRGYISYLKQYSDQLLCSIILTPSLFATYNIMKRFEDIIRLVIENIFDPLCQKLVRIKGRKENIKNELAIIKKIRNILLLAASVPCAIVIIYTDELIFLVGLNHYESLSLAIKVIVISQLLYFLSKIEMNLITLFYKPIDGLKCDLYSAFFGGAYFILSSMLAPNYFVLANRIFVYGAIYIYSMVKVNEKSINRYV